MTNDIIEVHNVRSVTLEGTTARLQVEVEESTEGMTRGEELEVLLHRPGGVTLDELVSRWGVKRESAAATLSVQTRKRGIHLERMADTYRAA